MNVDKLHFNQTRELGSVKYQYSFYAGKIGLEPAKLQHYRTNTSHISGNYLKENMERLGTGLRFDKKPDGLVLKYGADVEKFVQSHKSCYK